MIWVLLFYSIYTLLKNLKISRNIIYISLGIVILYFKELMNVGANYNLLAIAISILGINYIISVQKKNNIYYLIQGFITLLIFMTKQNIGIYYFLTLAICEVIIEKNKIKTKFINLILVSIPIILGVVLYCVYLYIDGALYNFIDYTFLGMKDFKQNLVLETNMYLLSLINIIPIVIMIIKKEKVDTNLKILFIFSIVMLFMIYPIVCVFHCKMALIYSIICFIYIINLKFTVNKTLQYSLIIISLIYFFITTILNLQNWIFNSIKVGNDPYFGAVYSESIDKIINNVDNYIIYCDKKVVIVSPDATFYNIRLNINNGILDIPVKGNVGINGKEKIINEIKNTKDAKFLIMNRRYYQEYQEVYDYIRNNYKHTDNVGVFQVYE